MSDLEEKFDSGADPYELLLGEFVSNGELVSHAVTKGPSRGSSHLKQLWKHKHSSYTFTWHHKLTKAEFDKSTLWKVADAIIKRSLDGSVRIRYVVDLQKKKTGKAPAADGKLQCDREEDMINRAMAVLGAAGSKQPLSVFFLQEKDNLSLPVLLSYNL